VSKGLDRIIKCGGHCYDGCGWNSCSFYDFNEETKEASCRLFGGAKKNGSESLVICNKVYGTSYEGWV